MQNNLGKRVLEFQRRIADEKIGVALIQDPDNIFYLTGFWGYLGMEFGRPTILIVPQSGSPTLVTPGMEAEMAASMTGSRTSGNGRTASADNGKPSLMIHLTG